MDDKLSIEVSYGIFVWNRTKELENIRKHGVNFRTALNVFYDPQRKIFVDRLHSHEEERFFCIGQVDGRILTVRFLYRDERLRIIGAGEWRKGRKYYGKKE